MTNFLPAGFIRDNLEEIREGLELLQHALGCSQEEREVILDQQAQNGRFTTYDQLLWQTVGELLGVAQEACDTLDRLPSDPVVYTGPGSTSEVIHMLEKLMYEHRSKKQALGVRDIGDDN